MEPDFTGWATRSGIRCTDGRTIKSHAFKDSHDQTVPLVWQHQHNAPTNVLGHVVLHSNGDGVRAEGFFNDTPWGKQAKALVIHKDIKFLSIYANQLVQKGLDVLHGLIREVSLVMAGANPGAVIDNVVVHSEEGGIDVLEDEAIFFNTEEIELRVPAAAGITIPPKPSLAEAAANVPVPDTSPVPVPAPVAHAADLSAAVPDAQSSSLTIQDVIDSMTDIQRNVLFGLVGEAMQQSDEPGNQDDPASNEDPKGDKVTRNVFDQTEEVGTPPSGGATLTHSDMQAIFSSARKGGSLKDAVEEYALLHGIDNIDLLFPEARAVGDGTPDWISRRQEWVANVLGGTHHTPFSRIKTMTADITLDEARARGYVKGAMKREEWFAVARRITTPQTVYKKQKLDRDDIVDITDFDVVAWLKGEMRVMLDEEIARAVLIGDGRDVADPDKIVETNIRPILTDSDVYITEVNVDDGMESAEEIVDGVMTAMQFFMGTGQPTLYCARSWITKMLLVKDTLGRRLHATITELADAMGVRTIVPVDVMESMKDTVIGIIVNLSDYTVGTDRGGEVNFFDDFDIDYNKFTYLYETRLSGALTKYKSAIVVKLFSGAGGLLPDPQAPTFNKGTGVVTIPDVTHIEYYSVDDRTGEPGAVPLVAGAQQPLLPGTSLHVRAVPDSTYAFASNAAANWTFQTSRDAPGPT